MQNEPSVLDFLKSTTSYWIRRVFSPGSAPEKPVLADFSAEQFANEELADRPDGMTAVASLSFPWRSLLALMLGLIAQNLLEPRQDRAWLPGVVCYVFAAGALIWANLSNEWALPSWISPASEGTQAPPNHLSKRLFLFALLASLFAFLLLRNNLFTPPNVTLWLVALVSMSIAFWRFSQTNLLERFQNLIGRPHWDIRVTRWTLVVLAGFALSLFFRTYLLNEVPSQMIGDHAEKLWDVRDVLNGVTSIFFTRNTGREFFQFYLTATIIQLFNTGLTFLSLKIGTVFAGLFALVYIYLLGKEVSNKRVGLIAMVFAGIA
jgi:hypothetical protein